MEEKSDIKTKCSKMSSYFEGLWRKQTAHILNSFFGIPLVLPSVAHSSFILVDDARPCSGEDVEKGGGKREVEFEDDLGGVLRPYFMRSVWFPLIFSDWMMPSFFYWRPERRWGYERDASYWDRPLGMYGRYGSFFNDGFWKEAFEGFDELRTKERELEGVSEWNNKEEVFGAAENKKDGALRSVVSVFTKKTSRTFGDGSYEIVKMTKKCFSDGTCETTEYKDSSNGKSVKKEDTADNKDLYNISTHVENVDTSSVSNSE